MPWAAAAIAGGSILSAGIGAMGSSSAAGQAAGASTQGAAIQEQIAAANASRVTPFVGTAYTANDMLRGDLLSGGLGQPFNMTEAALQQTPGYQFMLNQGLQQTQNAAAARGLGVSGAALKGAAGYATGLADQTYQQQFQNYWANQNNRYNMLAGMVGIGANAAQGLGSTSAAIGGNIGNALTTAGQAQAAGTMGTTNALTGSLNSLMTNPFVLQALNGGSTLTPGLGGTSMTTGTGGGGYFANNYTYNPSTGMFQ